MNEFPVASIKSWVGYVARGIVHMTRAFAVALTGSAAAGVIFGLSQVGCRNDAITYAKAIWPEASCTAINTSAGCAGNGPDVAVCRVGKLRYKCVASTRYDEPGCTEVSR